MNRRDRFSASFSQADRLLLWIYFILTLVGWLNIYSAVYDESHHSIFDMQVNYGRQLVWILTSYLLVAMVMLTDARFYSTFAYYVYFAVLVLLVAVIFIGKEVSGSKSWIQYGAFQIQPAEFAKLATSLGLAAWLGNIKRRFEDFSTQLVAYLMIFIPAVLILAQKETGSALVFASFILVLYREGMSGLILIIGLVSAVLFVLSLLVNKYVLISFIALLLSVGWFYLKRHRRKISIWLVLTAFVASSVFVFSVDYVFERVLQPHQKTRINVLLGKEVDLKGAGYNVHQSMIAIGSGGFWGKGYMKGTQTKYNYVPEQSTDFIFCTIGEEWGFVGSLAIIGLYVVLIYRLMQLAERQRTPFSRIYGYCVAVIFFFHMAINIGMTIGLLPVIGIPLPFLSYGGSSMWAFTLLLFIFIKLDAHRHEYV
ncbi:MAG: rod shape determining protein RodA [Bacteroidales bacterium]|jgi:rod shape determining protein RodA|nr:rod shape determining protein RodA [Bacteroidales bacterium]MDN5329586.1 rod shape determining protein RodA [Bacteroidales bacterium]